MHLEMEKTNPKDDSHKYFPYLGYRPFSAPGPTVPVSPRQGFEKASTAVGRPAAIASDHLRSGGMG